MSILQEIKIPLLAVNDTVITVSGIPFQQGHRVIKGEVVIVFETSKTTYDVHAESDGYIFYMCDIGNDYEVNEIVARIYSTTGELPAGKAEKSNYFSAKKSITELTTKWNGNTIFSQAALTLINQYQIDNAVFNGRDFVSRFDVEKHIGTVTQVARNINNQPVLLNLDENFVELKRLDSNKKREIEYLSSVQSCGLTSTISTVVETQGIFFHINESMKFLKDSLLPVMIYEVARLLTKYRELNGYFTGNAIALYKKIDIGFAVDIDHGLKVVKVKDSLAKSINQLEDEILNLTNKYIDDNLQIDDLTGVSFTITDLSAEKISSFRPLVNMMNSAILGISAVDEKLKRCVLSVTFDHRVTNGKTVARFLGELKERLESYKSDQFLNNNEYIQCFKCFKTLKEDLSEVGFAQCITPKGEHGYICQSCLKGF